MKIKNYLKLKKHPILFLLCLGIFAFSASLVLAGEIQYKPNIAIPGSSIFGGGTITITPNTLAEYIKAIYRYAGIIAGAFAMFMLVYGAWQWLMAAGNASKITMAKETVSTTLIGLAFLFGGYLLLSQISIRLVNLQPLVVPRPVFPEAPLTCAFLESETECLKYNCAWAKGTCIEKRCEDVVNMQSCFNYTTLDLCNANDCYQKNVFEYVCHTIIPNNPQQGVRPYCGLLNQLLCSSNSGCFFDEDRELNGDSEWCCEDSLANDYCRKRSEINNCMSD